MFKLRADAPTWAVAESEDLKITAFVSHDDVYAEIIFASQDHPRARLASKPVTIRIDALYDKEANACCLRPHTANIVRLAWELFCTGKDTLRDSVIKSLRNAACGLDNQVEFFQNPLGDGIFAKIYVDGELAERHLLQAWIAEGVLVLQDDDKKVFPNPAKVGASNNAAGFEAVARILNDVEE